MDVEPRENGGRRNGSSESNINEFHTRFDYCDTVEVRSEKLVRQHWAESHCISRYEMICYSS